MNESCTSNSSLSITSIKKKEKKKWTLGLLILGIVVLLWTLSAYLLSLLFEDELYRKPFLITYINTASFTLFLIPPLIRYVRSYWNKGTLDYEPTLSGDYAGDSDIVLQAGEEREERVLFRKYGDENDEGAGSEEPDVKLSYKETIGISIQFFVLWFSANFVTNASLIYTSVASQMVLSSTSSFFTLFIGALCSLESITTVKALGSLLSFIGVVFIAKADATSSVSLQVLENSIPEGIVSIIGNLLALLGAFFYGLYCTLLKWRIGNENRVNMQTFFGFVGLLTIVFLWPTLVILHVLGVERFEAPPNLQVAAILLINCAVTFVSDFCWAKAMLLTSPLTVTVGISSTIPIAILIDCIFKGKLISVKYLLGAAMLFTSFFIINKKSQDEAMLLAEATLTPAPDSTQEV